MVGVEDEEDVQRALEPRIGLVLELGHLVHHAQEVAAVGQVVVGIDVGHPHVVAVGEGGERRHLGDEPDRLDVAVLRILDVVGVGIEGRQRADRAEQHPHRVGVVAEALHEALDVLVHEGVDRDLADPLLELLAGGQLAVDEQVGDLEVGRLLGELLDRVAAVLEDAGLAVEEGDLRATRRGVHVRRVVGHQPEVVVGDLDLAEVGRAHRAVGDLDLVAATGAVVGDGQRAVPVLGYAVAGGLRVGLGAHGSPSESSLSVKGMVDTMGQSHPFSSAARIASARLRPPTFPIAAER